MNKEATVNILGTEYKVTVDDLNNWELKDADGKTFMYDKQILLRDVPYMGGMTDESQKNRFEEVVLHELIHAFGQESGTSYDNDEALTSYFARMIPKIMTAFYEVCGQITEVKRHEAISQTGKSAGKAAAENALQPAT